MSTTAIRVSTELASREALDALPSPVVVVDHAGAIVEANRAARQPAAARRCRLFGGGPVDDFFAACDRMSGPGRDDARAVALATRDVLAGAHTDHVVDVHDADAADPRWYTVRITGSDLCGGHRAVIVFDDVSDRRHAERARRLAASSELEAQVDARTRELREANQRLREAEATLQSSEARFRAAASSTADLIVEAHVSENRLQWFGDVDTLMGYEPGGFPRTSTEFFDHLHPDDRERVTAETQRALSRGDVFKFECRVRCKDGSYRHWESRGKAIAMVNGEPSVTVGSHRDITDKKQLEQARLDADDELQRNQDDLRGLTARLFSAQEDERRRLARELHPASLDQLGLVAAIKAFCARLTDVEVVDVHFTSRGIPDGLPGDVALCVFRLTQEALGNAARHSGSARIRVSVERVAGGLELRVVDDGRGFDMAADRRGDASSGLHLGAAPAGGREPRARAHHWD